MIIYPVMLSGLGLSSKDSSGSAVLALSLISLAQSSFFLFFLVFSS